MTLSRFEVAAGTVAGRDHRRLEKANQDGYYWQSGERSLVAVVTDGCGSGRHSEVGAKLGARLWTEALTRLLDRGASAADAAMFERARQDVLAHLRVVANAMGGSLWSTVSDYLLFTTLAAVVTPEHTAVISIGDGIVAVNGEVERIGPFPGNQPPYLAYGLLPANGHPDPAAVVRISMPTASVRSLAIATDGAEDVPDLAEAWTRDQFFRNADGLRRSLALLNREVVRADWEEQRIVTETGTLPDDTTIVAVRRKA